MPSLFDAIVLGGKLHPIKLKHRVMMAPLTRLRAGDSGIPTPLMKTYYGQRATDGGLIVAEATNITPTARGMVGSPGIYSEEQIAGWKEVTDAVHDKGGKIFLQLWHTGRVSHSLNQPNGELPVSASAVPASDKVNNRGAHTKEGKKEFEVPRALETDEIQKIVQDYKKAGINALQAGFDGVEVHAANGYLLEQFLCDSVNKRTDRYGESVENRSRFLIEVLDSILEDIPSSHVGIRLSPYGNTFGCTDSNPAQVYGYTIKKLEKYDLAYLHLIEPRGYHHKTELVPKEGIVPYYRKIYSGVIATASGYDQQEADRVMELDLADLVVFGRPFITNPDLVNRLKNNIPLTSYNDPSFFYTGEEKGYTDYLEADE